MGFVNERKREENMEENEEEQRFNTEVKAKGHQTE